MYTYCILDVIICICIEMISKYNKSNACIESLNFELYCRWRCFIIYLNYAIQGTLTSVVLLSIFLSETATLYILEH